MSIKTCVMDLYNLSAKQWNKVPGLKGKFFVHEKNIFSHDPSSSSLPCGCNYKIESQKSVESKKGKITTLSVRPVTKKVWNAYIDRGNSSATLGPRKVKAIDADKIDEETSTQRRGKH
jgi:hypothetical protein